ncbi:hypothetical protein IE969_30955 [Klebsiella pneumoniae]|nr:hypothetical protein [Klebsiella pneumoniae]
MSLTGPGEFLAWPASSRTEPEKREKTDASVASSQRKQGISPEVSSHALAGMTCISP